MTRPIRYRLSYACTVIFGVLASPACDGMLEGTRGATVPRDPPTDQPGSQDSNNSDVDVDVAGLSSGTIINPDLDATAISILHVLNQNPQGHTEESRAATVGQKLYTEFFSVGSASPWTVSMVGAGNIKSTVTCQQPGKVVKGTCTRIDLIDTTGLAPGTYDLLATFNGDVDGVTRTATITVHITLSER